METEAGDPLRLFASLIILEILENLTFKTKMILLSLLLAFREPTETKPVYLNVFFCRLGQM